MHDISVQIIQTYEIPCLNNMNVLECFQDYVEQEVQPT
jgi:hypothetical protein